MKNGARVLVACDLDPAGDQAIATASAWALRYSGSVTVLHASDRAVRDELVERVKRIAGREVEVRITDGAPVDDILAVARELAVDLIVLGGRQAHGTARVLGSVAERVVAQATAPVLIARAEPAAPHILAATDFSDASLPAVSAAHAIARVFAAPITLVHCVARNEPYTAVDALANREGADAEEISTARRRLREMCESSPEHDTSRVVVGEPAEAIVRLAEEVHASLVVIASHGRTGIARLVLGSVADKVLRDAPCSVLIVRRG
jgi:nucleotide-binding universal stress UspA family protein